MCDEHEGEDGRCSRTEKGEGGHVRVSRREPGEHETMYCGALTKVADSKRQQASHGRARRLPPLRAVR